MAAARRAGLATPRLGRRGAQSGSLPGNLLYQISISDRHERCVSFRFPLTRDFAYDPANGTCTCPAGKVLYRNGANCRHNGFLGVKFSGTKRDCLPCAQRERCLRKPETTPTRQVCFFRGKEPTREPDYVQMMKDAIDSDLGRSLYGKRFATVEPVFANLRHNKELDRFTLRGREKVDGQWKLFCLVHNIEKLAKYGMRGTIPRG